MKLLGHRFTYVGSRENIFDLSQDFLGLGLEPKTIFGKELLEVDRVEADDFGGAIFPVNDLSWVEFWAELPGLPKGIMLQLIVDDADAFAENAKQNGVAWEGPVDAHGERIYYLTPKGGLPVSFQSKLK